MDDGDFSWTSAPLIPSPTPTPTPTPIRTRPRPRTPTPTPDDSVDRLCEAIVLFNHTGAQFQILAAPVELDSGTIFSQFETESLRVHSRCERISEPKNLLGAVIHGSKSGERLTIDGSDEPGVICFAPGQLEEAQAQTLDGDLIPSQPPGTAHAQFLKDFLDLDAKEVLATGFSLKALNKRKLLLAFNSATFNADRPFRLSWPASDRKASAREQALILQMLLLFFNTGRRSAQITELLHSENLRRKRSGSAPIQYQILPPSSLPAPGSSAREASPDRCLLV